MISAARRFARVDRSPLGERPIIDRAKERPDLALQLADPRSQHVEAGIDDDRPPVVEIEIVALADRLDNRQVVRELAEALGVYVGI